MGAPVEIVDWAEGIVEKLLAVLSLSVESVGDSLKGDGVEKLAGGGELLLLAVSSGFVLKFSKIYPQYLQD